MDGGILSLIIAKYNYWLYIVLMMMGIWGMVAKRNLVKKIIGMNIFQTAIILFYVSIGMKAGAALPIVGHEHHGPILPETILNPLPHVLMLTAIVVAVATLGVALALCIMIYQRYHTLDEEEIMNLLREK
jgi:multicomponent Na+:H+ antiporter subunit C